MAFEHSKLPPCPPRQHQAGACFAAGFCVCNSKAGDHATRFAKLLVRAFRKGTEARAHYDEGRVIARISLAGQDLGDGDTWLHIAYGNLSLHKFTVLLLSFDRILEDGKVNLHGPLEMEGRSLWRAFDMLDLQDEAPWLCSLFHQELHSELLIDFIPGKNIVVQPLGDPCVDICFLGHIDAPALVNLPVRRQRGAAGARARRPPRPALQDGSSDEDPPVAPLMDAIQDMDEMQEARADWSLSDSESRPGSEPGNEAALSSGDEDEVATSSSQVSSFDSNEQLELLSTPSLPSSCSSADGEGEGSSSSESTRSSLEEQPEEQPRRVIAAAVDRAPRRDRFPRIAHGSHPNSFIRLSSTRGVEGHDMRAECGVHDCCTVSRTCRPSKLASRPGQGRPIGMLWAWLDFANDPSCSREAHQGFWPSLRERRRAREVFKTLPGAGPWLQAERAKRAGESSEPEDIT